MTTGLDRGLDVLELLAERDQVSLAEQSARHGLMAYASIYEGTGV